MFPDFSSISAQLYERACKVMPGGNSRTSLFWPPYQIYADRGSGSRVVDMDGVERTDFHYNFTVLIHGHSHPAIVERIREQAGKLTCVSYATEAEIELAELLCSRVPSFEKIRFTNSGLATTTVTPHAVSWSYRCQALPVASITTTSVGWICSRYHRSYCSRVSLRGRRTTCCCASIAPALI